MKSENHALYHVHVYMLAALCRVISISKDEIKHWSAFACEP